jgi:hypothetical protein
MPLFPNGHDCRNAHGTDARRAGRTDSRMSEVTAPVSGKENLARRSYQMGLFLWAASVVILGGGIVWLGMPGVFEFNSPDFFPVPVALAAFAAVIGTIHMVQGVLQSARFSKYGASTLEAGPAVLGKVYRGRIRTVRDLDVSGPFSIHLLCEHKSGVNRDRTSAVLASLWEASASAPVSTRSSAGIPFAFQIPANGLPGGTMPGSDGNLEVSSIFWTLSVSAPMQGLQYNAAFPVDVDVPGAASNAAGVARQKAANTASAFAGYIRPEQPYARITRMIAPVLGILLAAAGGYATVNQWQLGQDGAAFTGRIISVETPALGIALDGGGTVRIPRVTKYNSWQTDQPVRVTCRDNGGGIRTCRMDTGYDRWIDAVGTLAVGLVLLLVGGWLWLRWRARTASG